MPNLVRVFCCVSTFRYTVHTDTTSFGLKRNIVSMSLLCEKSSKYTWYIYIREENYLKGSFRRGVSKRNWLCYYFTILFQRQKPCRGYCDVIRLIGILNKKESWLILKFPQSKWRKHHSLIQDIPQDVARTSVRCVALTRSTVCLTFTFERHNILHPESFTF